MKNEHRNLNILCDTCKLLEEIASGEKTLSLEEIEQTIAELQFEFNYEEGHQRQNNLRIQLNAWTVIRMAACTDFMVKLEKVA